MIRIEIDGDKGELNFECKGKDIMVEIMVAVQGILSSLSEDTVTYDSLLTQLVGGLACMNYDELKESLIENE